MSPCGGKRYDEQRRKMTFENIKIFIHVISLLYVITLNPMVMDTR